MQPEKSDDYHNNAPNFGAAAIIRGIAKVMPAREKQLSPKQIQDVVKSIKSIHVTNAAHPKAPQGEREAEYGPQNKPLNHNTHGLIS
ncbi:hypothetical protein LX99_00605 [Mucilaginibacter oryzae]|uniref:Uncharacterized protein n=1 Tax=Mucilaginibacter oryzae TaxID=468058 RepID=A0A316HJB9_9SPHI|nr:hypothetical protein [Mucilaginibacter oryzae]PWK80141.1 hypothetical protein LX99_00605 [Mucilaginibacter oryzae]